MKESSLIRLSGTAVGLILAGLTLFFGVFIPSSVRAEEALAVGVTIPPQAYFVRTIGAARGETIAVEPLMPATADHETYEPSIAQLQRLKSLNLFFRVGHPGFIFESTWVTKLLKESGNRKLKVVDMFEPADYIPGDIHVWLSFNGGRKMARSVLDQLVKDQPLLNARFNQRYNLLLNEIDQLELSFKNSLSSRKRNTILVYHPAWGYLCREAGITQLSIEADGKEPSPMQLARLIARAKAEGITTVFADGHAPKANTKMVAKELNGRVVLLDPLSGDWLENMKRSAAELSKALN